MYFIDKLFKNSGAKIKTYSKFSFLIVSAIFIFVGIITLADAYYATEISLGLGYIIGGPIASAVASLFMYGFGEMVEKICNLGEIPTSKNNNESENNTSEEDSIQENVKVCSNCKTPFDSDADFCVKCGKPVPKQDTQQKVCKKCGEALVGNFTFCTKCGTKND